MPTSIRLFTICVPQVSINKMLSLFDIEYLDIAPLLPASVALTYIASIVFGWEQFLDHRIPRESTQPGKDSSLLPVNEAQVRPAGKRTYASHITSAALPILHFHFTASELWRLDRSKGVSPGLCLIQLALVVAEYALDGFRHRVWRRQDLMLLGVAWTGIGMYITYPKSEVSGIALPFISGVAGVASVLLPDPLAKSNPPAASISVSKKSQRAGSSGPDSLEPRSSLVHHHIFSVSLLLIHLVHDYPVVSSRLFGHATWSHFYIPIGLLLLRLGAENWYATRQHGQTLLQHVRAFASHIYALAPEFMRCGIFIPLLAIGPMIILFFVANYLTSCLGFRKLVFGLPRTTPAFLDGGVFGGFIYQVLAVAHLLWRHEKIRHEGPGKMSYLYLALVTAFGQTITALVAVAIIIYGLQEFC